MAARFLPFLVGGVQRLFRGARSAPLLALSFGDGDAETFSGLGLVAAGLLADVQLFAARVSRRPDFFRGRF